MTALTEAVTVIWVGTSSPEFRAMCLFFGSDRFKLTVFRWIPFLTLELTSAFWSIFGANRKNSTVGSTNLSTVRHTELRKIYIKIFNVIYLLKSYLSERDRSKSRSVHGKISGKFKKWVKTLLQNINHYFSTLARCLLYCTLFAIYLCSFSDMVC